jgi:hypothetical protein
VTTYVFCGPTISASDAGKHLDAEFLGPATQGALYRLTLERPDAIGLIDGYFDTVPSVWHKEILWALSQGIHVYGSASMGALRAAELRPFGMVGVGMIFERIVSGELEDDDEVAVSHGAADTGYRAASEPMINLRVTLERAKGESVVTAETAESLIDLAKKAFYAERSWPALLADGARSGVSEAEIGALRRWLPSNAVNQKRADAIAMLQLMSERGKESRAPFTPSFEFEHTAAWEIVRQHVEAQEEPLASANEHDLTREHPAIEEAQIGGRFSAALQGAFARTLAVEQARAKGRVMEGEVLYTAIESFRRDRGLHADSDFERWLEESEVGDLEFFKEEAQARLVQLRFHQEALRMLPNHLRSTGEYRELTRRARDKHRAVSAVDPTGADNGASCDEQDLFRWYFEQRLRRAVPVDLDGYARQLGMSDRIAFRRAVWRERVYVGSLAKPGE